MKHQDHKGQNRSYRDRPLRPGEIARRSKMYTTSLREREQGAVVIGVDIHDVPKCLRRRRVENVPALEAPYGDWAVDATTKELNESRGRPNARHQQEAKSLRNDVLSAFVEANKSLNSLRTSALAKQRLKKSLPNLDDLIHIIDRDSTAHALNGLPAALSHFGEDPKRWEALLSALDQLPELYALVGRVLKSQQRRGPLGSPFDDAFIRELAKIWKKRTGHRPPEVVKEAQSRRSTGHLFRPFVERAFSDIGQPSDGLEGRIRRVLSAVDL